MRGLKIIREMTIERRLLSFAEEKPSLPGQKRNVLCLYVTAPGEDNSNQGKDDGVDEGDPEGMRAIDGDVRLSSDSRDRRFGRYERLGHNIQDRTK
jgi:hypothetical protein